MGARAKRGKTRDAPLSAGPRTDRKGVDRLPGITDVRQECHLTRAFDRDRDLRLVFPAGARVAAALNLAPLGDEAAELRDVLEINCRDLFPAEEA